MMKNEFAVAETVADIADVTEVKEEISKFGEWVEGLIPRALDLIIEVAVAFIFIVIGMKLIKWTRKILRKSLEKNNADTGLVQFLDSLVKYALYIILALTILQRFGVQTTSIVAAIGSVGVAIGLAKPFKVGDYVIQGSLEGTVSEIQLFYTTLTTADNRKIIIPNGQLADNSLINATAAETRRVDIKVGISYNSDVKAAKDLLLKLGTNDPDTLKEEGKAPMAAVDELADSSVNMLLRVWTTTDKYWDVKFRLTEAVKMNFDEAGIEIPYNQLDVHLINS